MIHHHYTQEEKDDADQVDDALEWIRAGHLREGQAMLQEIAARAPELYVYNFGNEDEVCIKFWSMAEYLGYIAMTRKPREQVEQEVIWLKSAYPRALYELAMLDIAAGNDAGAAEYLDGALQLEPDHPDCLLRIAEIYARDGDAPRAIEHYDLVLGSRPYMSAKTMAHALGGKARQLIDLDQLDDAEACLEESLHHGPGNQLAMNLKRYIESVRAGNVTPPVEIDGVESSSTPPPADAAAEVENVGEPEEADATPPAEPPRSKPWWRLW